MKAVNAYGGTWAGSYLTAITLSRPVAPQAEGAYGTSTTSIRVHWRDETLGGQRPPGLPDGYIVTRYINGDWVNVSGVLSPYATYFDDTGLTAGALHSYWVRAFRGDPADQSRWAWAPGYVSANTYAVPGNTLTPDYVYVSAGTTTAYIVWDDLSGATIKRKIGTEWVGVGYAEPGQSWWQESNLAPGTYYAYWVFSDNGEVARSYATVITARANAPKAISAAGQSSSSARIVFLDRSSNEVGHNVYRYDYGGNYWPPELYLGPDVNVGDVTGRPPSTENAYWVASRWGTSGLQYDQGYIAAATFAP